MTDTQKSFWHKIRDFEIDDPSSSFKFSDRLARENGWSLEFALRVILEYKRFIFLICSTGKSQSPSDEVDQAWHLHMIYTRSYWKDFCGSLLGMEIHHGPTKGGSDEKNKHLDMYAATLEDYEKAFGTKPPTDIWSSPENRFKHVIFERVNKKTHWVIKKLF